MCSCWRLVLCVPAGLHRCRQLQHELMGLILRQGCMPRLDTHPPQPGWSPFDSEGVQVLVWRGPTAPSFDSRSKTHRCTIVSRCWFGWCGRQCGVGWLLSLVWLAWAMLRRGGSAVRMPQAHVYNSFRLMLLLLPRRSGSGCSLQGSGPTRFAVHQGSCRCGTLWCCGFECRQNKTSGSLACACFTAEELLLLQCCLVLFCSHCCN